MDNIINSFPGYEFVKKWNETSCKYDRLNMFRGINLGLGGYVYAEPGIYQNVALLDIASLHPSSIIALKALGDYTDRYAELVKVRKLIKHKKFDEAKKLFNGKLEKYLTDAKSAKKLSTALKTAINACYGLTSAPFANQFKDPRNENNIVAVRGALFMKTLQDEVSARGFTVVHIKTDSIKIANATKEIIDFCMDFAKKYGYEFEHEATYDRICLVNDAVYIAKYSTQEQCKQLYGYVPEDNIEDGGHWTATGTQFAVPYVFKTCFSREKIVFDDMCEIKEVKNSAIYLDFNENLDSSKEEIYRKVLDIRCELDKCDPEFKLTKSQNNLLNEYCNVSNEELWKRITDGHDYRFVGRVGYFCPIKPGYGGAELVKEMAKKNGTVGYDAVTGAKGYRWLEAANVKDVKESDIDRSYYDKMVTEAINSISQYGDYYWFVE